MMDEYHLKDVTVEAKDIAQSTGYERLDMSNSEFGSIPSRVPLKSSFNKKGKDGRFKAKGFMQLLMVKNLSKSLV